MDPKPPNDEEVVGIRTFSYNRPPENRPSIMAPAVLDP
jgi:hypothetical protein